MHLHSCILHHIAACIALVCKAPIAQRKVCILLLSGVSMCIMLAKPYKPLHLVAIRAANNRQTGIEAGLMSAHLVMPRQALCCACLWLLDDLRVGSPYITDLMMHSCVTTYVGQVTGGQHCAGQQHKLTNQQPELLHICQPIANPCQRQKAMLKLNPPLIRHSEDIPAHDNIPEAICQCC